MKIKASDLQQIKKEQQKKNLNYISVGMNTCGIAAGAGEIYDFFKHEINKLNLNISIRKCGCIGTCFAEPIVEIVIENMPKIIYGKVTKKIAARIVEEHLIHKKIIDDYVYDLKVADDRDE